MILRLEGYLSYYAVGVWTHDPALYTDYTTLLFKINGVTIYSGSGAAFVDIITPIDCGLSTNGNAITLQSLTIKNSYHFTFNITGLDLLDSTTLDVTLITTGYKSIIRTAGTTNNFTIYGYDLGNNDLSTPVISNNRDFKLYLIRNDSINYALSKFIVYRNPNYITPNNERHLVYGACSNVAYTYDTIGYTSSEACPELPAATVDCVYTEPANHTLTMTTDIAPNPTNVATYVYGDSIPHYWYVDDVLHPYYIFENTICNTFTFTSLTFYDYIIGGTHATLKLYQFDGLVGGSALWVQVGSTYDVHSGQLNTFTITDDGVYKFVYTSVNPNGDKFDITIELIFLAKCNAVNCILSKLPDLICCKATDTCKEVDYYQFNSFATTIALAGIYFYQMNQIAPVTPSGITANWIYRLQDIVDRVNSFCSDCNTPCNCSNDCNCVQDQTGCY